MQSSWMNLKERGKQGFALLCSRLYESYSPFFYNRLNKGKIDGGPTNYYADSESILALDGAGFNSEVHGMSWESSGQTRFG